jgi:FlaA1/EpsC-like NDP-sugar epimerase
MGKPVRIYDLAVNMIRLSGLRPDVDIPIVEIGLRPGEKLYEELLIQTEKQEKTENNLIFIEKDTALSREEVQSRIDDLCRAADTGDAEQVKKALAKAVPTYRDPKLVNSCAERAAEMQLV